MREQLLNEKKYYEISFVVNVFPAFLECNFFANWWSLSCSGIRVGNFIDLGAVLRWSECFQEVGTSVYGLADAECGGHVYGSALLRTLNLLAMNALQTQFWGILGGVGKVTTWHFSIFTLIM